MGKKIITVLLSLILVLSGCTTESTSMDNVKQNTQSGDTAQQKKDEKPVLPILGKVELGIHNTAMPMKLKEWQDGNPMGSLPKYDPNSDNPWPIDLRSRDISKFDLTGRAYDLLHSDFNSQTIWPKKLPKGFDPNKIIELNKTPGLNIDKLHKKGITGKGVGVAIIDFALVVDHIEYKDKIKFYEHIRYNSSEAHFHGPMVTSICLGKNIGVAPGANLYFIANDCMERDGKHAYNHYYSAQAIRRVIELNKILPPQEKIKVLSFSMAWEPELTGYDDLLKAVDEAEKEGIFVVSCNMFQKNEGFFFHGIYKEAMDDPNDFNSYKPYAWKDWLTKVYNPYHKFVPYYAQEYDKAKNKKVLLIPMGGITYASATGNENYEYTPDGGWSSAVPYIAGLYALFCQVRPDMTPEIFWNAAYDTGETRTLEKDGTKFEARIPSPEKMLAYLQKK